MRGNFELTGPLTGHYFVSMLDRRDWGTRPADQTANRYEYEYKKKMSFVRILSVIIIFLWTGALEETICRCYCCYYWPFFVCLQE